MSELYFAYGSNLDLDDLRGFEKRLKNNHEQNLEDSTNSKNKLFADSVDILSEIFFLPDYKLSFPVFSSSRNGGVLDISPKKGHAVPGKLFKVDNLDLLNKKEGAPNFYKKIDVTVIDINGKSYDAITYTVNEEISSDFIKPNKAYVDIILKGYDDFGISEKYPWTKDQLILASENILQSGIDKVFVYGTLKKGQCRESVMSQFSESVFPNEKINGTLIDVGSFPGLINSKNKVNGEIHQTEKIANLLETVDSIEGFLGYNASSLFTRILTLSDSNMCWTYLWNGDTNHPIIESGNWE